MTKRDGTGFVELALGIVEALAVWGTGSAAAAAALMGQFMLAVALACVAFGIFLRFKRGRVERAENSKAVP